MRAACGFVFAAVFFLGWWGDPSFVFWTAWVPNCRMTWISSFGLVCDLFDFFGAGGVSGGAVSICFACLELRSVLACLLHFCLVSLQWLTKILALPVPACLPTCVVNLVCGGVKSLAAVLHCVLPTLLPAAFHQTCSGGLRFAFGCHARFRRSMVP